MQHLAFAYRVYFRRSPRPRWGLQAAGACPVCIPQSQSHRTPCCQPQGVHPQTETRPLQARHSRVAGDNRAVGLAPGTDGAIHAILFSGPPSREQPQHLRHRDRSRLVFALPEHRLPASEYDCTVVLFVILASMSMLHPFPGNSTLPFRVTSSPGAAKTSSGAQRRCRTFASGVCFQNTSAERRYCWTSLRHSAAIVATGCGDLLLFTSVLFLVEWPVF